MEWLAGEGLGEYLQHLLHGRASPPHADSESSELDLTPPETQPEDEPALAEKAHRGGVLGET